MSQKAHIILQTLTALYPSAKVGLDYTNALELLMATILSAQANDKQINKITPALFKKCPTAQDYVNISSTELEKIIHSSGFYKNKAKNLKACAQKLVSDFGGHVPRSMHELVTLPGVGRKTANVVLSEVFGKNEGVCVDTHVLRLSEKLGLTKFQDAVRVEQDLMKAVPQQDWKNITTMLITHGREVCFARKPNCEICPLTKHCVWYGKNNKKKME